MTVDVEAPLARALRSLQVLDEVVRLDRWRDKLIEAESILGAELGLACAGVPGGWNEDGTVACYDHDGETCPVHEWLVEADCPEEAVA